MKRNETVWIPLFTAEMPYKHIYTWRIRDFVDGEDHYQAEQEGQDRKAGDEIWHSCRLTNVLAMPLTTAAAQFLANGEFTGQDVCCDTAPKSETTIRINKALNLLAEQAEIEVDRKREASLFHGYRYDLVSVRGQLKLRNRLGRQVTVEITKGLSGEVLESAPRATDTKTAAGLKKVNPKHVLTWLIALKADEEQKMARDAGAFDRLQRTPIVVMGPTTTQAVGSLGLRAVDAGGRTLAAMARRAVEVGRQGL